MKKEKIDRISELTRISRVRELTPEETQERAQLRQAYIADMKRSLESTLDHTYIVDENGNKTAVRDRLKS